MKILTKIAIITGKILLIIFGGIAGFFIGTKIGESQGYTGGDSIMALFYGIIAMPIGGLIVLLLIFYFSKRSKKAQKRL